MSDLHILTLQQSAVVQNGLNMQQNGLNMQQNGLNMQPNADRSMPATHPIYRTS